MMQTRSNGRFESVYGRTLLGHHWIDGEAMTGDELFESRNPAHSLRSSPLRRPQSSRAA